MDKGDEGRRREKENAEIQPIKALLDPERACFVYTLSKIQESLSRSTALGISFDRQFETDPKDFFYVYVDREGEIVPFGQRACVNTAEEPRAGDTVLVWEEEIALFVQWKQRSKTKDYGQVNGVV